MAFPSELVVSSANAVILGETSFSTFRNTGSLTGFHNVPCMASLMGDNSVFACYKYLNKHEAKDTKPNDVPLF